MAKNQWRDSATAVELRAMGVSTTPGRGWRILALLVVIGAATFLVAYYVPLFRAHSRLSGEYAKLSKAANSDRQKLADTVKALKSVSSERDQLERGRRASKKDEDASAERMTRVRRELEDKLSKGSASKLVRIEAQGGGLDVLFTGNSLFARNGAELSAAGKGLLCVVSQPSAAVGSLRYELWGLGAPAEQGTRDPASLRTAIALAESAAGALVDSCKVDSGAIVVRASTEPQKGGPSAPLRLRLEASSDAVAATPAGPGGQARRD